jgi:hypothetical protein
LRNHDLEDLEDGRQKVYLTAALEGKRSKRYYPTHHDQDYAYVANEDEKNAR